LKIARKDADDRWTRLAVLSSAASRSHLLFEAILRDAKQPSDSKLSLLAQCAAVVGARNRPAEVSAVLAALAEQPVLSKSARRDLFISLGDGLLRTGKTLASLHLPADSPSGKRLAALVADASRTAFDAQALADDRAQALHLLAHAPFATAKPAFEAVMDPRQPQTLQLVAVRAMRTTTDAAVAPLLLKRWKTYTPLIRGEVAATLSARPAWATALLDAVEAGTVARAQIDSARQAVLKNYRDPIIRNRAAKLFLVATPAARQAIIARYKSAAKPGSAEKGLTIFRRECALCHRAGNVGQIVGPPVATFRDKSPEELLIAILDPNREVDPRYLNYTVNLTDGRTTSGLIAGESPSAITLRRAEAIIETVLRSQIEELKSTGLSLMPEQLEGKINPTEMADLIAFVKQAQ
jgi:putative heme-binding domain-containing protein